MTRAATTSSGGAAGAIVLAGPPAGSRANHAAFAPAWARVAGRLAWTWSVDALAALPHIGCVALVVEARRVVATQRMIAAAGWRAVRAVAPASPAAGEADAPDLAAWLSTGLAALANGPGGVLLHEGARPQLPASLLNALFAAWDGTSVVAAASPVTETLKVVDEHRRVHDSPPRDRLWQLRPPLLLPGPLLERILAAPPATSEPNPPDASLTALVTRAPGVRLRLVSAGHEDVVVRHRADVRLVEALLRAASATQ